MSQPTGRPIASHRAEADRVSAREQALDYLVEGLLYALLVFMPAAFGVVHRWSELVVVAGVWLITLLWALKHVICPSCRFVSTWAYLPIALFLLLIVGQLIPWPVGVVEAISLNTASLKQSLVGGAADYRETGMRLSLYPFATEHALRLLLAVAGVFVVTLHVFNEPGRIRRLLAVIALIGGAAAVLSLAQKMFGNGRIYWMVSAPGFESGPFVNRNNFGQFMVLSAGAAVAWLLSSSLRGHPAERRGGFAEGAFGFDTGWRRLLAWAVLSALGLCAIATALSLSRGGVLAFSIAGAAAIGLLAWRWGTGRLTAPAAAVAVLLVGGVVLVTFEGLYGRFAGLAEDGLGARLRIWLDLLGAWAEHPLVGFGLGAHEIVYPVYQELVTTSRAVYADGEYAQILAETGLIGSGLVVGFLATVGVATWRSFHDEDWGGSGMAIGLSVAVIGVVAASAADFGQRLPANACLSAIMCALLMGLAVRQHEDSSGEPVRAGSGLARLRNAGLGVVILIALGSVGGGMVSEATATAVAEHHWASADSLEDLRETGKEDLPVGQEAFRAAAEAKRWASGNIRYHYGWLRLRLKRLASRDDLSGDERRARAEKLVRTAQAARQVAPTYAPLYKFEAVVHEVLGRQQSAAEAFHQAFRLDRNDPELAYLSALHEMEASDLDDAQKKFRRAVRLDGALFKKTLDALVPHYEKPRVALEVCEDDPGRLFQLVRMLERRQASEQGGRTGGGVLEEAIGRIERRCSQGEVSNRWIVRLAEFKAKRNALGEAAKYYRDALRRAYGNIGWRERRARILMELGRYEEAKRELEICLRLDPGQRSAKQLLGKLVDLRD